MNLHSLKNQARVNAFLTLQVLAIRLLYLLVLTNMSVPIANKNPLSNEFPITPIVGSIFAFVC